MTCPAWLEEKMTDVYASFDCFSGLEIVKTVAGTTYFRCPWGCKNYAYAHHVLPAERRVLNCVHCGKQGWIDMRMGEEIKSVLSSEEKKFRKLLSKFEGITSLTAEQACKKWHSEGLPLELAEELVDDTVELNRLVTIHRSKGQSENARRKTNARS